MLMPDILQIGIFFGILFSGELIATLLFLIVNRSMKRGGLEFSGVIRGVLERAFCVPDKAFGVPETLFCMPDTAFRGPKATLDLLQPCQ